MIWGVGWKVEKKTVADWQARYGGGSGDYYQCDVVARAEIGKTKFRTVGDHHEFDRLFIRVRLLKKNVVLEELPHGSGTGAHLHLNQPPRRSIESHHVYA